VYNLAGFRIRLLRLESRRSGRSSLSFDCRCEDFLSSTTRQRFLFLDLREFVFVGSGLGDGHLSPCFTPIFIPPWVNYTRCNGILSRSYDVFLISFLNCYDSMIWVSNQLRNSHSFYSSCPKDRDAGSLNSRLITTKLNNESQPPRFSNSLFATSARCFFTGACAFSDREIHKFCNKLRRDK
jgi:hypothetical protein